MTPGFGDGAVSLGRYCRGMVVPSRHEHRRSKDVHCLGAGVRQGWRRDSPWVSFTFLHTCYVYDAWGKRIGCQAKSP